MPISSPSPHSTYWTGSWTCGERVWWTCSPATWTAPEHCTSCPSVWSYVVGRGMLMPSRRLTWVSRRDGIRDRKSTRLNSSHRTISYAVFCLKKKNNTLILGQFVLIKISLGHVFVWLYRVL